MARANMVLEKAVAVRAAAIASVMNENEAGGAGGVMSEEEAEKVRLNMEATEAEEEKRREKMREKEAKRVERRRKKAIKALKHSPHR